MVLEQGLNTIFVYSLGRGRVLFKKYTSPALLYLFYLRYANRGIPFFVGSSTNPCVSGLT